MIIVGKGFSDNINRIVIINDSFHFVNFNEWDLALNTDHNKRLIKSNEITLSSFHSAKFQDYVIIHSLSE